MVPAHFLYTVYAMYGMTGEAKVAAVIPHCTHSIPPDGLTKRRRKIHKEYTNRTDPMSSTPNIPGFNVPLALRQLGNNVKLYNKLLDQFQKSYASAAQDIAENVAGGDYETAERSAHTIKGLAGSLGATALQEVSAKLEKTCREQIQGAAYDEALAAFAKELGAAIAAIRSSMAAEAPAAPAAPAVSANLLASQLAALAAHVDDSDAKALMLFDEIKTQVAAYDQNAAGRLAAAFELFDFVTAAEVIAALRSRLG